jgi:hypothetical protein
MGTIGRLNHKGCRENDKCAYCSHDNWISFIFTYGGYVHLFDRNKAWKSHVDNLQAQGIVDIKRTPQWDRNAKITGVASLIFGIIWWGFLLLYLWLPNK